MLNIVPGLELEGRELVQFWYRQRHDFLHHGVSFKTDPDRPVSGHLGVQDQFDLGGDLPDSRSQDEEIKDPVFTIFWHA
eukprot:9501553-Heterocapsa_arctica.AAC.1